LDELEKLFSTKAPDVSLKPIKKEKIEKKQLKFELIFPI